jgi:hypothetical protein
LFTFSQFREGARKIRGDILKGLANRPIEVFALSSITAVQFMDKNSRSGWPEIQELLKNDSFLLGDNPGMNTERLYRSECIVRVGHWYCIDINKLLTFSRSSFASILARRLLSQECGLGWPTKPTGANSNQRPSHLPSSPWLRSL